MKKLLSIFAVAGLVAITGCSSDDDTVVEDATTAAPATDPAPPAAMDTMTMPAATGMTGSTGAT